MITAVRPQFAAQVVDGAPRDADFVCNRRRRFAFLNPAQQQDDLLRAHLFVRENCAAVQIIDARTAFAAIIGKPRALSAPENTRLADIRAAVGALEARRVKLLQQPAFTGLRVQQFCY